MPYLFQVECPGSPTLPHPRLPVPFILSGYKEMEPTGALHVARADSSASQTKGMCGQNADSPTTLASSLSETSLAAQTDQTPLIGASKMAVQPSLCPLTAQRTVPTSTMGDLVGEGLGQREAASAACFPPPRARNEQL